MYLRRKSFLFIYILVLFFSFFGFGCILRLSWFVELAFVDGSLSNCRKVNCLLKNRFVTKTGSFKVCNLPSFFFSFLFLFRLCILYVSF